MGARLTIAKGAFAGRRFPFDESITLGRAPDCGVVVNHPQVSSRHARIVRRGDGEYVLEDNDSRNGTFLAGTRIHGSEALGRLDVIDLGGGVELIFQVLVPDPRPGSRAATAPRVEASPPAPAPAPAPPPEPVRPPTPVVAPAAAPPPAASTAPSDATFRGDLGDWVLPPGVEAVASEEEKVRTMGGAPGDFVLPAAVEAAASEEEKVRTMMGDPPIAWVLPPEEVEAAPVEEKPKPSAPPTWVPPRVPPPGPAPSASPLSRQGEGGRGGEVSEAAAADAAARLLGEGLSGRIPRVAPPPPPRHPTPPPAPRPVLVALEIHHEDGRRETVPLPPGEHVVGRGAGCEVVIDKDTLSRRHTKILVGPDGVTVDDLGSTNHTYVEGRRIHAAERVGVGTTLRFGAVEARLVPWEGRR